MSSTSPRLARTRGLAAALLALTFATAPLASAGDTEFELFERGMAALDKGDWEEFLEARAQIDALYPRSTSPAACALRGFALYAGGHEAQAFELLWQARSLDDLYVDSAIRFAAFKSAHYEEARTSALEIPDAASSVRDEWLLFIDGPFRAQTPLAAETCEAFTKGRRARVMTDLGVDRRLLQTQLEATPERGRAAKVVKLRKEHRALAEVTDLLDKVFRAFDTLCDVEPDSHTVPSIYVLRDRRSFDAFNLRLGNQSAHSAVGFHYGKYDAIVAYESEPDHAGPFACSDALRQTLVHEAFHQWLETYVQKAPTWFNEGLAEYFEEGRLTAKALEVGGVDADHRARLKRDLDDCLPLQELVMLDEAGFYDSERLYLNYAQAWSLVHFLASDRKGQELLRAYFRALNAAAGAEGAYRAAFGAVDMTKLEARWRAYVLAP